MFVKNSINFTNNIKLKYSNIGKELGKVVSKFAFTSIRLNPNNLPQNPYSAKNMQNINSRKIFKFSKNSEDKKHLENKKKIAENMKRIKILKDEIKKEDILAYTAKPKENVAGRIVLMKSTRDGEFGITNEHTQKKADLIKELRNLKRSNLKMTIEENEGLQSKPQDEEKDIIRASMIKDIFSHQYAFNNKFLSPSFYEPYEDQSIPYSIRREEEEVISRQNIAEAEIRNVVEEMIDKELKGVDIFSLKVPVKVQGKKIIRSLPAKAPTPGLLLENDQSCSYELGMEYERLLKLGTMDDDFGNKIKEEDEEKKDKGSRNVTEQDPKDLLNNGQASIGTSADSMITNIAK